MGFKYLKVERRGGVEYLELNRPEVRNAFNEGMIAELTWWADSVKADAEVRAAVIAGAGSSFCAGADLDWMARMASFSHDQNLDDASEMARLFTALDQLPIPLIGRIHGAALGGGTGLAAICDIVVAAEDAVFGFTEVRLGLIPAVISPFVIAKIGRSVARELFLTGERFSARRAYDLHLVHAVVPAAQLDVEVSRFLTALLKGAPGALMAAKRLIAEVGRRGSSDVGTICAEAIAERRASDEGREGVRAFLEKRDPSWRTSS